MSTLAGVDEAGRGPVIGPLVVAIAALEKGDEFQLQTLGVKDSKLLTPKRREQLYKAITDLCKYEIIIVPPEEVDEAVESSSTNLNWLEAEKMALLIDKIKPDKVILDAPSSSLESYEQHIKGLLKFQPKNLIAKHKADRDHPIVAAASVLAKVTRDWEIQKIKDKYNIDFGSGYPSDPKTIAFLKKNWDKYPIFRKSWETWKQVANSKSQKSLGEF
ncbi:ribonuclease HII [Nanoarchaeota archaeon]